MKLRVASLLNKKIGSGSEENEEKDNEVSICNEPEFDEIDNQNKSQVKSEAFFDKSSLENY